MIFCGACGTKNNFPMSSMRTNRAPCELCGGYDKMQVQRRNGSVETRELPNYSYPENLLPSVVEQGAESND